VKLALWIATEMTKGLGHAHSRRDESGTPLGIVHRDVSPANVLLSWDGGVKITDFGIARMTSRVSHTAEGMVRGKASYLAPEQASAQELDGRTDLFAVGITLWEMIAGKKLFAGDSPSEVMAKVMVTPIPPPSTIIPGLPAPVDQLLAKMLDRDPAGRFQDAAEQERALTSLLAKMGGANASDVAAFLAERFPREIEDDLTRQQAEAVITVEVSPSPLPPPAAAQWTDEQLEPRVEKLDDDARRKLFGIPGAHQEPMPERTAVASAATVPAPATPPPVPDAKPHFLELDTGQIPGPGGGEPVVVETVRVGSMLTHILRASAVAVATMGVMIALIRFVYRY
jgi:serine/threonine protein kinase